MDIIKLVFRQDNNFCDASTI